MARRAWEKGWQNRYLWARPIREVLAEEHRSARAKAQELEDQRIQRLEDEADKARKDAVETLAMEASVLKLARADLQAILGLVTSLIPSIRILVDRLKVAIDSKEIDVKQTMTILTRVSSIVHHASTAADKLISAERLRSGDPTVVIEHRVEGGIPEMTIDEARAELGHVSELLEMAAEQRMLVAAIDVGHSQPTNGSGNGTAH